MNEKNQKLRKVPDVNNIIKKHSIGQRVSTPNGNGTITGIDLPESRVWRYIVCLDNKGLYKNHKTAYYPRQLKAIYEIPDYQMKLTKIRN